MLKNVPKQRLLLYILLLGLLPIIIAIVHFLDIRTDLYATESSIEEIHQLALVQENRQAANLAVRSHFHDADHFYIDKYLETLTFLEPEIESLQKIQTNSHFADDEAVRKRLELLTGPGNSLAFSEGVVQTTPLFKETTETLVHPVEINIMDMQNILARIEGIQIGSYTPSPNRPQLIILDFKIDRKPVSEKNEVFLLNLKLLKREYP